MSDAFDPFAEARRTTGIADGHVGHDDFVMALRYADIRSIARDWRTFTSDVPFRVPIPSEHDVRRVRQLPIEADPPEHGDYRRIVLPPFSIAAAAANAEEVKTIASELLGAGLERGRLEIVRAFALPLQSRALATMLGRPREDADEWISWGTHVFRDFHDSHEGHAAALDGYLERAIDEAIDNPGEDFFGLLARARLGGRALTREEMLGFANLTFAGGRDTIINSIANVVHYLAQNPQDFDRLRADPALRTRALEEFLRFFSPLTHLGRIVRKPTELLGRNLETDSTVSLCFASGNRDETVFEQPHQCVIDRYPNRHLAFGFGPHTCLGAPHARTIMSVVIELFTTRVSKMSVISATPTFEDLGSFRRQVGFDPLNVAVVA